MRVDLQVIILTSKHRSSLRLFKIGTPKNWKSGRGPKRDRDTTTDRIQKIQYVAGNSKPIPT